jgi:hypothetical protein
MFSLLAVAVAAGVAAGLVRGGSLRRLSAPSVPGWVPVGLIVAGSLQAVLAVLPAHKREIAGRPLLLASGLLAAATLLGCVFGSPRLRRAAVLAVVGGGLNAAVVLANGGMPVPAEAARHVDVTGPVGGDGPLARHVLADGTARLSQLGDVLPFSLGYVHGFISVGDVLLLAAAGLAVHDLLTRPVSTRPMPTRPNPEPPLGGSRHQKGTGHEEDLEDRHVRRGRSERLARPRRPHHVRHIAGTTSASQP